MKKFIYIFSLFIFFGCTNVKHIYVLQDLDVNNKSVQNILDKFKAKENNKSIIFFTSWFEKDTVELINGDNLIFRKPLNTVAQLSFTTLGVVLNDEKVTINILTKKPIKIILNQEELKKHKFIYISRDAFNRKKITVEYSNIKRDFY
jgi:hypothetical protein